MDPRLVKSQKKSYKGKRKSSDPLKVVYISSPMKVKTSAARFRSLVQQLTGKNSDVAQYMEGNNNDGMFSDFRDIDGHDHHHQQQQQIVPSISPSISDPNYDTPTSSDSFLGTADDVFITSQMKEQLLFEGLFSSDSFYDASQMDMLGSYEELLWVRYDQFAEG